MNDIIQGLWIGPELSVMEELSIASFLENGHEYHLYAYGAVKNLPAGTVIKDANEILPSSRIFKYKQKPSYAGFANFFRYKLLFERGGWWADTDMICLKTFDFSESHVFASEICNGVEVVTSGIIKAPRGSEVMAYAWEICQTKAVDKLVWGETGPGLMGEAVKKFSLAHYQKPHYVFCPLGYLDWHRVLEPHADLKLDEGCYAIHLWNEMWRVTNQDKNARYHPHSLYEKLKRGYMHDWSGT
ncbi:MAG TPA: glycosyltransferase [Pyrinomonadaceae bacterium]|nr:glycosyltransferase [Pyrinomonadaceae bacterium]